MARSQIPEDRPQQRGGMVEDRPATEAAADQMRAQAEELATARQDLAAERRHYRYLFDFAPDAYLESDGEGTITRANLAAAGVLGIDPERLIGQTLFSLIEPISLRAEVRARLQAALNGERQSMRTTLAPPERSPFPAILTVQRGGEGEQVVRWILRDVTDSDAARERMADLEDEIAMLRRLADLAGVLVNAHPLDKTLGRMLELTMDWIPGAKASIMLRGSRGLETAASTDPVALDLDQAQYDLQEGPCLDALRTGTAQRVEVASDDDRYPRFGQLAAARGVQSILAQPLLADGVAFGALNVYSTDQHAFLEGDDPKIVMLADQGSFVIENARLYAASAELSDQLAEALASRPLIEQAKGVLMAREGCDEDRAFDILRRASQRTNVKLRDIARKIVDGTAVQDGGDGA